MLTIRTFIPFDLVFKGKFTKEIIKYEKGYIYEEVHHSIIYNDDKLQHP